MDESEEASLALYLVGLGVGVVCRDEQRDGVEREEQDGRPLLGKEPLVLCEENGKEGA
jgi:hypothetical protein